MKPLCLSACLILFLMPSGAGFSADWPGFRGPAGLGASQDQGLPTTWSASENIVWRTQPPGPGSSSPVVVGDRVYLTCYSGYGLDAEAPGEKSDLLRHVLALDRASGQVLWQRDFRPLVPESTYSPGNRSWHGYATSTPTSDGQRLYVFFGASGVYCLDLADGAELWHSEVGSKVHIWGSGNSLLLYDNLLIVNAAIESDALLALDKASGKPVWRVARMPGGRNTPIIVRPGEGRAELVLSLAGEPEGKIVAYDPESGQELWHCQGIPDADYVCPSVVAHEGVVYAIGGRKNTALAVRAGGRGDVTDSHVAWRTNKGCNVGSPVYHQGCLYWVHDQLGTAICLDAATGKVLYEKRLDPRPGVVYSSLTAADGKLYSVSQHNGTFVLAARPEFEVLAHNTLGEDDYRTNASLAVHNGQFLLRDDRFIYCIGK